MSEAYVYTPEADAPLVIGLTGLEAIRQNIRVILLTFSYMVPLDRGFAHQGRFLDSPAPASAARLLSQLWDAIEKYEPRVKVENIEFEYSDVKSQLMEGRLTPRITFRLKDEANGR